MTVGEKEEASINCTDKLAGATLSGTPSVSVASGLTLGTPSVNSSTYDEKKELTGAASDVTVAVNKAIQFPITATAVGRHTIKFNCDTSNANRSCFGRVLVVVDPA